MRLLTEHRVNTSQPSQRWRVVRVELECFLVLFDRFPIISGGFCSTDNESVGSTIAVYVGANDVTA
jgi:hypothetical protein